MSVKVDGEELGVIVSHYRSLEILIRSAKKNKDYRALAEWDKARNMKMRYHVVIADETK